MKIGFVIDGLHGGPELELRSNVLIRLGLGVRPAARGSCVTPTIQLEPGFQVIPAAAGIFLARLQRKRYHRW